MDEPVDSSERDAGIGESPVPLPKGWLAAVMIDRRS
jgi:hypothetical protein